MKNIHWTKFCKSIVGALVIYYGLTSCHLAENKWKPYGDSCFIYHHNPVSGWVNEVDGWTDGRTPKVIWYAPENKWIKMVATDEDIRFYDSKDQKEWRYISRFGEGYHVQPSRFRYADMIELSTDGNSNNKKWALIVNVNPGCYFGGSATQYFIGLFDGTHFVCDNSPNVTKWLDWGKDYYATNCMSNTTDSGVLAASWMNNWQYYRVVPIKPAGGVNALLRELSLYEQDGDIYLSAFPVMSDIKTLRKESKEIPSFIVNKDYHIESLLPANEGAYELSLNITSEKAEIMGFSLFNDKGEKVDIYFNLPEKKLVMDRTKSGLVDFEKNSLACEVDPHEKESHELESNKHESLEPFESLESYDRRNATAINYINEFALATWAPIPKKNEYKLDIFVDKCSVEMFLDGGRIAMTNLIFPTEPYNRVCFYSKGGTFKVNSFKVYRLNL